MVSIIFTATRATRHFLFLRILQQRLLSHLSIVRDHRCCLGRQLVRLDREHRFVQKSEIYIYICIYIIYIYIYPNYIYIYIYIPNMAIYGNFNGKDYGNAQTNCGYPMFKHVQTKSILSWYIMVMKIIYKRNWRKYSPPNFGIGICNSVGSEGAHVFEGCCQHPDQYNLGKL